MKTLFTTATLAAALSLSAVAQDDKQHTHGHADKHAPAPKAEKKDEKASDAKPATEVVKRGEALGDSPSVAFKDVLGDPQKFAGKTVIVEGIVERVCKAEGCWMQIAPEAGAAESVRVTFDHKFSVPKDADKMRFRAEGVFRLKVLSKEEVEHLVKDDGAKLKTNADGTANEISFVATGVELWK